MRALSPPLRVDDPVVPPLPGSTGIGFVSGALLPLVASPGGMRRPHILRSVEELRVICRVFRAGGFLECCAMLRAGLVALRRFGVSVWFALVRFRGDLPAVSHCPAMARYDTPGVRRYASVCAGGSGVRRFASPSPVGGGTGPDMARILSGSRSGEYRTVSQCRAMARLMSLMHCPTVPP